MVVSSVAVPAWKVDEFDSKTESTQLVLAGPVPWLATVQVHRQRLADHCLVRPERCPEHGQIRQPRGHESFLKAFTLKQHPRLSPGRAVLGRAMPSQSILEFRYPSD